MQWEKTMNGSVSSLDFEIDKRYLGMENNTRQLAKISKKRILSFAITMLFILGNSDRLYEFSAVQGQGDVICGKIATGPLACPGPVHYEGSIVYLKSCDNQIYVIPHEARESIEGYVGRFVRIVNPAFGQIENVCGGTDYGIISWSGIEIISSCNECKSAPPEEDSRPSSVVIWIDRDCGGYYDHGDRIAVYFRVTSPASTAIVTIIDYTTGGKKEYLIANESFYTNKIYELGGTVKCPSGKETLQIIATIVINGRIVELRDECYFYIGDCPDPCENIHCSPICRGYDLWQQECQDGECVYSDLIEENSKKCGYDLCENIHCGTACRGYDLWQQECQDGECVYSDLIEENSKKCGACPSRYDPESPNCRSNCPDSDNDGVPDCNDECPNTPVEALRWYHMLKPFIRESALFSGYINPDDGCIECYSRLEECGVSIVFEIIPIDTCGLDNIYIDFCEAIACLAQGDLGKFKENLQETETHAIYFIGCLLAKATGVGEALTHVTGIIMTFLECVEALSKEAGISIDLSHSYDMAIQKMQNSDLDVLNILIGSPVSVEIRDSYGNTLNSSNRNGIPNSCFLSIRNEGIVIIGKPKGNYEINIEGTQEGTYDLRMDRVHKREIISNKFEDIYISNGEVDTYSIHTSSDGQIEVSRKKATSPFNKYTLSIFVAVSVLIIIALIYLRGRKKGTVSQSNKKKKDIQKGHISEEDLSSRNAEEPSRHERKKMFFENLAKELSETKKKKEDN